MSLSRTSRLILESVAKGHSYEQILVQELAWTYDDIFEAAREALQLISSQTQTALPPRNDAAQPVTYDERLNAIRQEHKRAYEKWTAEDDQRLRTEFQAGRKVNELAILFQRQPGAIKSRLDQLGLSETRAV